VISLSAICNPIRIPNLILGYRFPIGNNAVLLIEVQQNPNQGINLIKNILDRAIDSTIRLLKNLNLIFTMLAMFALF